MEDRKQQQQRGGPIALAAAADASSSSSSTSLWSSILASTARRNGGGRAGAGADAGVQGTSGSNEQGTGGSNSSSSSSSSGSSKRVIVMGAHDAGKSTLISSFGRRGQTSSSTGTGTGTGAASAIAAAQNARDKGKGPLVVRRTDDSAAESVPDLGINYEYIDLTESTASAADGPAASSVRLGSAAAEEDLPSHLSVYTVPSPISTSPTKPSPSSLLPLALTAETLLDSVVLIALDWEKPSQFVEELQSRLAEVQACVQEIEKQKGNAWIVQEGRDSVENHIRTYVEPTVVKDVNGVSSLSGVASTSALATSATQQDRQPLPEGTLEINLGVPILVVCTKSDNIQTLERQAQLQEEQADYIQQTLRSVCLQYGASLHFTTRSSPATLARLRAYVIHRLFSTVVHLAPPPAAASASADTAQALGQSTTHVPAPHPQHLPSRSFPFPFRANAVDREALLVPSGWDSWGKIKVLREGFDPGKTLAGWREDLETRAAAPGTSANGVRQEYKAAVGAIGLSDLTRPSGASSRLDVQHEQDFFRAHYEILAREFTKHQTQTLQNQSSQQQQQGGPSRPTHSRKMSALSPQLGDGSEALAQAQRYFGSGGSAGVVGPLASGGLSLPSVEKVLQRDSAQNGLDASANIAAAGAPSAARSSGLSRRDSSRPGGAAANGMTSPPLPISPATATSPTPGSATQPQNEVLANFFQSLLNARSDRSGSPVPAASAKASPSPGAEQVKRSDSRSGR